MSSDVSIKVSNLGKRFQFYDHPHDRLTQSISNRIQKLSGKKLIQYEKEFWALKNISFEVRRGETVGIIGRNGSGKSTLLQLICGTLYPTEGQIKTNGRIAALLELGSGFNMEFTGRENIYMNGAILGLSKQDIDERYDQIVAFADIGEFIDRPVKIYSSGMYVRLAFSVIAHVDADILVVDEALSVGDAIFTQKCMRFIREFQERGTLLFVSHDTSAVRNLCKSAIWLKDGQVQMTGPSKDVSESYLQYTLQEVYGKEATLVSTSIANPCLVGSETNTVEQTSSIIDYASVATVTDNTALTKGWKTGHAEILSVSLTHVSMGPVNVFEGGERVRLIIRAKANEEMHNPILGFLLRDRLGQDLFGENTLPFTNKVSKSIEKNMVFEGVFEFELPMLPNGEYALMSSVADGDLMNHVQHHWMHDALIITISSSTIRWGLVGIKFNRVELNTVL